ncbi:flavin reductase family protein [Streptomyces tubbatahanensis]|uniref:Flavin reductase family protein n=1 Tax=Streptomyces tubbatahanensis TaxID=2923272 RepID=A0ABY3Y179_9ACTN|nr:flavin reductase family protein [Streptomyces tubbatahanensis]UNT00520.1 flavin reductase family protein [Streptomyces tubbatahanensis]
MTADSVTACATRAGTQPTPVEMRRAMSTFATGVTVVTAVDAAGEPVGFACQSFASVSLEPPLVLFCADHKGRTWPRIREAGRFCVNVLAEDQSELCGRFGSGKGRKYDGLAWDLSRWRTPALRDVLMRAHAEVYAVHAAGDHDVVIGRVLEVEGMEGGEGGPERDPMLFFRGRFGLGSEPDDAREAAARFAWGWGDHWG